MTILNGQDRIAGATNRIIVSADETAICPKCSHKFPLHAGIAQQTIEQYEQEFATALHDQTRALEEKIEKRLLGIHRQQVDDLQEKLRAEADRNAKLASRIEEAREEGKSEAVLEAESLKEQLKSSKAKVAEFTKRELDLLAQKDKLESEKAELALSVARQVEKEKNAIEAKVKTSEAERFRMIEAEYKKKIADAQAANAALQRKLEQGSQQLQGEVLELEIEAQLRAAFPLDAVDEIKKGARGADIVQTVHTRSGQAAGRIVWESKRAENWSNNWIAKLKEDQQKVGAKIAVLVTTTLPKDASDPFFMLEGVWVARPEVVRPVAESLRFALLEQHKSKLVSLGRNEKMEALYDYVCSPQFAQRLRAVVDAFRSLKSDLDAERAAMERIWKKREKQIDRVTANLLGVCGELQAISEDSVPALDEVARLEHLSGDAGE